MRADNEAGFDLIGHVHSLLLEIIPRRPRVAIGVRGFSKLLSFLPDRQMR
jgi:hypothetical protein